MYQIVCDGRGLSIAFVVGEIFFCYTNMYVMTIVKCIE